MKVGTLEWARRSGGKLSRIDKLRYIAEQMIQGLHLAYSSVGIKPFNIDIEQLRIPDTVAVKSSTEMMEQELTPWLRNHSLRTYLWGLIFSKMEKISIDEELYYVSCAFHDIGLTDCSYSKYEKSTECFTIAGAKEAINFGKSLSWPQERCNKVAEAIILHQGARVTTKQGNEAHILQVATSFDVCGIRARSIDTSLRNQVLSKHPRLDMKEKMVEAFAREASCRPHSRTSVLYSLGLSELIKKAPFGD